MFDLISPNHVSDVGFVAAIQSASLGNALTTMATMFELTERTGILTLYPGILDTPARNVCAHAASPDFVLNGHHGDIDLPSTIRLAKDVSTWVGGQGAVGGLGTAIRRPADLQDLHDLRNKLVVVASPLVLSSMSTLETSLIRLCAQGNGVILTGAYWPQYLGDVGNISQRLRGKLEATTEIEKRGARRLHADTLNIGIHIRGGDYRVWLGGKYFFALEAYCGTVRALAQHYPQAQFHVFTNERYTRADFPDDLPISILSGETGTADFLNLGQCVIVVGPPSTYGTWAAYLGVSRRLVLTPERIAALMAGANPEAFISEVTRPTFSYAPGVDGPL